jgi:SAM-dependent methyltransferase
VHSSAELWKSFASGLEADHVPLLDILATQALELLPLGAKGTVLNVEAGSGTLALLAARRVRRVICTEDWPSSYDRLTKRLLAERSENIEVERAAVDNLPFPSGGFDAALWVFPLWLPMMRTRALCELRRVVKEQSHLIVIAWNDADRDDQSSALDPWPVQQIRSSGFGNVQTHELRYQFAAPSEAALLCAREAPYVTHAEGRRARHVLERLVAEVAQASKHHSGPIALSVSALVIDAT